MPAEGQQQTKDARSDRPSLTHARSLPYHPRTEFYCGCLKASQHTRGPPAVHSRLPSKMSDDEGLSYVSKSALTQARRLSTGGPATSVFLGAGGAAGTRRNSATVDTAPYNATSGGVAPSFGAALADSSVGVASAELINAVRRRSQVSALPTSPPQQGRRGSAAVVWADDSETETSPGRVPPSRQQVGSLFAPAPSTSARDDAVDDAAVAAFGSAPVYPAIRVAREVDAPASTAAGSSGSGGSRVGGAEHQAAARGGALAPGAPGSPVKSVPPPTQQPRQSPQQQPQPQHRPDAAAAAAASAAATTVSSAAFTASARSEGSEPFLAAAAAGGRVAAAAAASAAARATPGPPGFQELSVGAWSALTPWERAELLHRPTPPAAGLVRCYVIRHKQGLLGLGSAAYDLHLEANDGGERGGRGGGGKVRMQRLAPSPSLPCHSPPRVVPQAHGRGLAGCLPRPIARPSPGTARPRRHPRASPGQAALRLGGRPLHGLRRRHQPGQGGGGSGGGGRRRRCCIQWGGRKRPPPQVQCRGRRRSRSRSHPAARARVRVVQVRQRGPRIHAVRQGGRVGGQEGSHKHTLSPILCCRCAIPSVDPESSLPVAVFQVLIGGKVQRAVQLDVRAHAPLLFPPMP